VLTVQANEQRLVVVGAGGFGREVAWLATLLGREVVGFVDDRTPTGPPLPAPLLGDLPSVATRTVSDSAEQYVLGIGQPAVKVSALERLPSGLPFTMPLIHPSAVIATSAIGVGTVVAPLSVVMVDSVLGDHTLVNYGASVGHDVRVGRHGSIMPGARLSGFVTLGERVLVGANAVVLEGLTIGDDVSIGAGAVVTRDVPSGATVVGAPARPIAG
jgi:sugar O-acyltransferase (sialic acid O-acetyltransferase NeuD family)